MARTEALSVAELEELEALLWEEECRGWARPNFGAWQERNRSNFDWSSPHFALIHERLDLVTSGDLRRLILEVAIRHGKTESVVGYAAYRIHKDPSTRVLLGTYSRDQAHKLSRRVRRLVKRLGVDMSKEADAVGEWETAEGGGVRAVGAGSGVASVNADLILIDDPIGKREEAESEAHREGVWLWITTDILARAEPHTGVVVSMPRWHADDPVGRMKTRQDGRWDVVRLPGVAEDEDLLGREPGVLLWPELRPQEWMDEMRVDLGSYGFASAMQCRPVPREGGMFKWAWLEREGFSAFVDEVPAEVKSRVRYWDTAGTEDGGDYTAGVRVSQGRDGLFYIEHVHRGQWAPGRRDSHICQTADDDVQMSGGYEVGLEAEAGIGGKDRTAAITRKLAGYRVFRERPTGPKEARADPVAGQMEVGNVRIVRGDWNHDFIEELLAFPNGTHDDQIDALSGAFKRVAKSRKLGVQTVRVM